jgi:hypothetical protein
LLYCNDIFVQNGKSQRSAREQNNILLRF